MPRNNQLSPREREILLWACRGKTYADISLIVGLANATIKSYLDTARHKLNVVNLTQACAVAVATGILTPDEILNPPPAEAEAPSSDPASAPPPRQNLP
jgi:DNA-binding CsgD family transcriptional regulator